jgi:hypothetical protein
MASLIKIRLKPERRELRTFGIAGAIILLVITALRWRGAMVWQSGAGGGGAAALLFLALIAPTVLRPLYVALSVITFPIGWVASHVLLAVLFFALITPLGLLLRLFGRDRMGRTRKDSYYLPRKPAEDKSSYFRQY